MKLKKNVERRKGSSKRGKWNILRIRGDGVKDK